VTITGGGNVGIGSAIPTIPLTLKRDLGVAAGENHLAAFSRGAGSDAGVSIGYRSTGSAESAGFVRSTASMPLSLGTSGVQQILTLNNAGTSNFSGNLGVGVASPSYPITVNQGTNVGGLQISSNYTFGANFILDATPTAGGDSWQFASSNSANGCAHCFAIYDITSARSAFQVISPSTAAVLSQGIYAWSTSSQYASSTLDTGLSRGAAGKIYAGNGNQGDFSGTLIASNVGVGTTSPTEKLHVVGNLRVQGTTDCTLGNGSGGTSCSSDIRLKDHVRPIEDSTRKIASLRGVEFDWNEKSSGSGTHAIGVIAQEVEKVFPTAVMEDNSTGYKKVDYAVLVAPLIQAFNEMGVRMASIFASSEKHEAEIARLKQENAALKARMDRLERVLLAK
jgi:hypothetical protein